MKQTCIYKELESLITKFDNITNIVQLEQLAMLVLHMSIAYDEDGISNHKILIKNFLINMLSRKAQEIFSKCNSDEYPSLNKILRHKLCYANDLEFYLKKFPLINRNIGTIPKIFFKNYNGNNKKEFAEQIYSMLSYFAMKLNFCYESEYSSLEEQLLDEAILDTTEFTNALSKLLKQKVNLTFIGAGYNGNGFKLEIGDEIFFYKTFFLYREDDVERFSKHGCFAEPQMALFANANASKCQFTKFFFGRVAGYIYYDSFIISKFITPKAIEENKNKIILDYISLNQTELSKFDNLINGKIVDFGGIREVTPELRDKKLRRITRIILNCIQCKSDENQLTRFWFICKNNIKVLQNLQLKYGSAYIEALNVIKKYIVNISDKLINTLTIISDIPLESINISSTVKVKDIFINDVEVLQNNLEYHNLNIKTKNEPFFTPLGTIIIDLYNNIQAVFFYDLNNKIKRIRIEKFVNNEFEKFIDITDDFFDSMNKEQHLSTLFQKI